MDFTNFAGIEFVHAIEAQREFDRNQKKWLVQWHELRRAADKPAAPKTPAVGSPKLDAA
ncbi:MAG: hypothetical protein HY873_09035 [Chloroflexi bacterium]|nr:hypothetical protein [Chloroflexota bacterium]